MIDFTQKIYDLEGEQLVLPRAGKPPLQMTLADACEIALVTEYPNEQADGTLKAERFRIFLIIKKCGGQTDELIDTDTVEIKMVAALNWSPLVYGQIVALLAGQPNPLAPSKEPQGENGNN